MADTPDQIERYYDRTRRSVKTDGGTYVLYDQPSFRPTCMSDTQWQQARAYLRGEEVPSDPDLIRGLCYDVGGYDNTDPFARWAFTSVAGVVCGQFNFEIWCRLIQGAYGPDYQLDAGL